MKKERIFQKDWLTFHPYRKSSSADGYYVQIANKVFDVFQAEDFGDDLSVNDIKEIACAITAYFEDVISGIGMFKAFTNKHRELYGYPLPFFKIKDEEYFEDEINEADIRFLIWHYLQQTKGKRNHSIMNPDNTGIQFVAMKIFLIFDKEYETAPENTQFKNFFAPEYRYNEYFDLKTALQWLQWNSYLFYHQDPELMDIINGIKNSDATQSNFDADIYNAQDNFVHNEASPLLALYPNEWLSEIITPDHPDYQLVLSLGRKNEGIYLYTGETENHFVFRNLKTKEEINVIKRSIPATITLKENETVSASGFIRFDNEWWMTGAMATYPYSKELEEELAQESAFTEKLYHEILKKADNEPVHYFGNKEDLFKFFDKVLDTNNHSGDEVYDSARNLLAFISPNGISVFPDICDYIKDERNPFYNEETAKAEAFSLYVNMYDHPAELINTLHNKQLLPDAQLKSLSGEERGKELIQGNAGFIMRYFYRSRFRTALANGSI